MSHPDSYPAASTDDIVFDDRIVGYVNRDGAIHMVDGERDREIGHVANDRDFAIGVLRDRYLAELDATRTWCAEVRGDEQRLRRFSDADRRLSDVDALYVLGDLELIRSELRQLGEDLRISQKARIAERDTLIAQVKQISDRTDWKTAAQELDALAAQFKAFGTVGDREIDTKQWDAFKEHERAFRTRRRQHFAEMEAEFANRAAAKEQLCEEAEQLAGDPDVRAAGLRMRQLMDHWKEVGFAGRERDDALWARFNAARDVFNTHRTEWYTANAVTKQDLAEQAEALMQQEDVADAQIKMKPLMQQWKATGSAGKEADDALWGRFRAAQDDVYTRSRVVFDARQAERDANYAARQALISEAESLLGQDSRTATARCKELQAEWKKIGPVSRERGEAQWKEFRAICDRIFGRAQQENKRRAQDARGHAEDQIRKLSAEIDEHERKIAHWEEVIAGLRDGPQADEIRTSMEEKIATARQRIELKLTWIEEQHRRMTDLGSRL
ncbi:MAG: DUF349 domain-containing protein [Thermomicrobiales bacterium]|nr:DUF349 domain-containing protein [Thermomicrobiales bacterium]MCO5225832.1 DUF349 domain-containing protein [Thermomicrobiales bacterium]